MAVLAHPDDESLGFGGTLARYAMEGVETHLVTATRGERGRYFTNEDRPTDDEVGRARERELREAARELGLSDVRMLGYMDGALDRADEEEAVRRIAGHLRRVRPQVVLTFDPFGGYGHPDHIAISRLATTAVVEAAAGAADGLAAHRVDRLYYMVFTPAMWDAYQVAFRTLVSRVDGTERRATPWPDWSVSARIDTSEQWARVWRAVQCHRSQLAIYGRLAELGEAHHRGLWGTQTFYRAMGPAGSVGGPETDLFAGLAGERPAAAGPPRTTSTEVDGGDELTARRDGAHARA